MLDAEKGRCAASALISKGASLIKGISVHLNRNSRLIQGDTATVLTADSFVSLNWCTLNGLQRIAAKYFFFGAKFSTIFELENAGPGKMSVNAQKAMRMVRENLRRYPFVIKSDVKSYYASIDHGILRAKLSTAW